MVVTNNIALLSDFTGTIKTSNANATINIWSVSLTGETTLPSEVTLVNINESAGTINCPTNFIYNGTDVTENYEISKDGTTRIIAVQNGANRTKTVSDSASLGNVTIHENTKYTVTGAGAAQMTSLTVNGTLVVDPPAAPVMVAALPTFGTNGKIALAEKYAENTCGLFRLITYPVASSVSAPENGTLADLVDSTSIKSGVTYTVTEETTPDSKYHQLVLRLGDYDNAAQSISIAQFGDSITEGIWRDGYVGTPNYRIPLMQRLEAAGYKPTARGFRAVTNNVYYGSSDANGVLAPDAYKYHTGISAQRIYTGMTGNFLRAGFMESIEAHLEQVGVTDVITLKIGTNDSIGGETADNMFEGWTNLVWKIVRMRPTTAIVVCSPIYIRSSETAESAAASLRTKIANYVALSEAEGGFPANHVFYLNGASIIENAATSYLADSVHPNWVGYNSMADGFFTAVTNAYAQKATGTTYTAATTSTAEVNVPAEYRKGFVKLATFNKITGKLTSWVDDAYAYTNEEYAAKYLSRIAYYAERKTTASPDTRFVWVDMDAWGNTLADMGVATNTQTHQVVKNLHIYSNSSAISNVDPTESGVYGSIKFTSKGFAAGGSITNANVKASAFGLDWNDTLADASYGCMAVYRFFSDRTATTHREAIEGETLFNYNGYCLGDKFKTSFGIGNFAVHCKNIEGNSALGTYTLDWTFASDPITSMTSDNLDSGEIEIWGQLREYVTNGVISVNFAKGAKSGADVASDWGVDGLVDAPNFTWNNTIGATGTASDLIAWNGTTSVVSGAAVTYKGNGVWTSDATTSFMKGYLDVGQSASQYVTLGVTNVPYSCYDIVLYAPYSGDSDTQWRPWAVNGTWFAPNAAGIGTNVAESAVSTLYWGERSLTPEYGKNAMRIKGIIGDAFIRGNINNGSHKTGGLAAIQIVEHIVTDDEILVINAGDTKTAAECAGYVYVKLNGGTLDLSEASLPLATLYLANDSTGGTIVLPNGTTLASSGTTIIGVNSKGVAGECTLSFKVASSEEGGSATDLDYAEMSFENNQLKLVGYSSPWHHLKFEGDLSTASDATCGSSGHFGTFSPTYLTVRSGTDLENQAMQTTTTPWSGNNLLYNATEFTITTSLKIDTGSSKVMVQVGSVNQGTQTGIALATGDEGVLRLIATSGADSTILFETAIGNVPSQFHDYAITYDTNKQVCLYIDGVAAGESVAFPYDMPGLGIQFGGPHGSSLTGYGNASDAVFEDFAIYAKALGEKEIKKLAESFPSDPTVISLEENGYLTLSNALDSVIYVHAAGDYHVIGDGTYTPTDADLAKIINIADIIAEVGSGNNEYYTDVASAVAAANEGEKTIKFVKSVDCALGAGDILNLASDTKAITVSGSGTLRTEGWTNTAITNLVSGLSADTWTGTLEWVSGVSATTVPIWCNYNDYANANSKIVLSGVQGYFVCGNNKVDNYVYGGTVELRDNGEIPAVVYWSGSSNTDSTISNLTGSGTLVLGGNGTPNERYVFVNENDFTGNIVVTNNSSSGGAGVILGADSAANFISRGILVNGEATIAKGASWTANGGTLVSNVTLHVAGASSISGGLTIANGATLDFASLDSLLTVTGTVTVASGDTVTIDLDQPSNETDGTKIISWTAQPEGTFELTGLAKNRYNCSLVKQADGLYVTKSNVPLSIWDMTGETHTWNLTDGVAWADYNNFRLDYPGTDDITVDLANYTGLTAFNATAILLNPTDTEGEGVVTIHIPSNVTLSVASIDSSVKVTGSGRFIVNGFAPALGTTDSNLIASLKTAPTTEGNDTTGWMGAFEVADYDFGDTGVTLGSYGNAKSSLAMNGSSAVIADETAATFTAFEIGPRGFTSKGAANGKRYHIAADLVGTGKWTQTATKNGSWSYIYVCGVHTNFTGDISTTTVNGQPIVLAPASMRADSEFTVASGLGRLVAVAAGAYAKIGETNTWESSNGAYVQGNLEIAGTLTGGVNALAGAQLTIAGTVSGDVSAATNTATALILGSRIGGAFSVESDASAGAPSYIEIGKREGDVGGGENLTNALPTIGGKFTANRAYFKLYFTPTENSAKIISLESGGQIINPTVVNSDNEIINDYIVHCDDEGVYLEKVTHDFPEFVEQHLIVEGTNGVDLAKSADDLWSFSAAAYVTNTYITGGYVALTTESHDYKTVSITALVDIPENGEGYVLSLYTNSDYAYEEYTIDLYLKNNTLYQCYTDTSLHTGYGSYAVTPGVHTITLYYVPAVSTYYSSSVAYATYTYLDGALVMENKPLKFNRVSAPYYVGTTVTAGCRADPSRSGTLEDLKVYTMRVVYGTAVQIPADNEAADAANPFYVTPERAATTCASEAAAEALTTVVTDPLQRYTYFKKVVTDNGDGTYTAEICITTEQDAGYENARPELDTSEDVIPLAMPSDTGLAAAAGNVKKGLHYALAAYTDKECTEGEVIGSYTQATEDGEKLTLKVDELPDNSNRARYYKIKVSSTGK